MDVCHIVSARISGFLLPKASECRYKGIHRGDPSHRHGEGLYKWLQDAHASMAATSDGHARTRAITMAALAAGALAAATLITWRLRARGTLAYRQEYCVRQSEEATRQVEDSSRQQDVAWAQSVEELEVLLPLPPRTLLGQVSVALQPHALKVSVDGVPLFSGALAGRVRPHASSWRLGAHTALLRAARERVVSFPSA